MKKWITAAALAVCTLGMAQETPKKSCCAGKDVKSCSTEKKKTAHACDGKDHKSCTADQKAKKAAAKKSA